MKLSIVTPNKKIVENLSIKEVTVPIYNGELNILSGHVPLVSTLSPGALRYRTDNRPDQEEVVAISWGFLEIFPGGVNILAETAELPAEIDVKRSEKAQKVAIDKLATCALSEEGLDKYSNKLYRSLIRQQVALKVKK